MSTWAVNDSDCNIDILNGGISIALLPKENISVAVMLAGMRPDVTVNSLQITGNNSIGIIVPYDDVDIDGGVPTSVEDFRGTLNGFLLVNPCVSGGGGAGTLADTLALGNDADTLQIKNLANGTSAQDAVTKIQLDGVESAANVAQASANAATILASVADAKADAAQSDIDTHEANTSNPHSVTKSQVGLGNADNTSDANKPISTATQTALNAKEGTIAAGTTSQYFRGDKTFQTLDKSAVGLSNVDNTSDATKNSATATLTNKTLTSPVINSPTGIVKGDIGLGNVDNTSDVNKPVSTAQATADALNLKIASNLSDINNASTGRSNLGVILPIRLASSNAGVNPADSTTYYLGNTTVPATTSNRHYIAFPFSRTLTDAVITVRVLSTLGTSETSTISLDINNGATNLTLSSAVTMNAAIQSFIVNGLSQAVTANQTLEIKWVTPAWATNPLSVVILVDLYFK